MTDDRGAAALVRLIHRFWDDLPKIQADYEGWPAAFDSALAAAILGEHGVFLPDGAATRAFTTWLESDEPSAQAEVERLRAALEYIRDELGVPGPGYPMPIANAANRARAALAPEPKP